MTCLFNLYKLSCPVVCNYLACVLGMSGSFFFFFFLVSLARQGLLEVWKGEYLCALAVLVLRMSERNNYELN